MTRCRASGIRVGEGGMQCPKARISRWYSRKTPYCRRRRKTGWRWVRRSPRAWRPPAPAGWPMDRPCSRAISLNLVSLRQMRSGKRSRSGSRSRALFGRDTCVAHGGFLAGPALPYRRLDRFCSPRRHDEHEVDALSENRGLPVLGRFLSHLASTEQHCGLTFWADTAIDPGHAGLAYRLPSGHGYGILVGRRVRSHDGEQQP